MNESSTSFWALCYVSLNAPVVWTVRSTLVTDFLPYFFYLCILEPRWLAVPENTVEEL